MKPRDELDRPVQLADTITRRLPSSRPGGFRAPERDLGEAPAGQRRITPVSWNSCFKTRAPALVTRLAGFGAADYFGARTGSGVEGAAIR